MYKYLTFCDIILSNLCKMRLLIGEYFQDELLSFTLHTFAHIDARTLPTFLFLTKWLEMTHPASHG